MMKKHSGHFIIFFTMCHLFLCSLALASDETCRTNSTEESLTSQFLAFCSEQIPGKKEILSDITYVTPLDFIVCQFIDLGGPTGKTVLRDLTKIPALYDKVAQKLPVGGTKYIFDESNIWSQYAKVGTKVGFIVIGWGLGVPAKISAPLSNYPGDILSRALVKSGMDKQDLNDEREFLDFLAHSFGLQWIRWVGEGVIEAVPKNLAMQMVSTYVFKSHISPVIGTVAFVVPNYLVNGEFTGADAVTISINVAAHLATRHNTVLPGAGFPYNVAVYKAAVYSAATLGALSFSYLQMAVTPYVLAAPARFIQNGLDKVCKKIVSEVQGMMSTTSPSPDL